MRTDGSTDRKNQTIRVLFVDDEPLVIRSLRRTLSTCDLPWEAHFSGAGESALAELAERPFDVIASDMLMPGMDGTELLSRVQREHPDVARIIVTGLADPDAIHRRVPTAHLSLLKPFETSALVAAVSKAADLRRLLTKPNLRAAIGANPEFFQPPPMFVAATHALAEEASPPSARANILADNIAVSVRVTRIASQAPRSAFGAIVLLAEIATMVALPAVARAGFSVDALERHSTLTARLAARIVGRREESERAFIAGLLHDIGELVLAKQRSEEVILSRARSAKDGISIEEAEQSLLGVSHAAVGACLLGLYGFPFEVIDAVLRHHEPTHLGGHPLDVNRAVYVANLVSRDADGSVERGAPRGPTLGTLGSDAARLDQWRRAARELAGQTHD